jgi:acyl-CoA hydrolase
MLSDGARALADAGSLDRNFTHTCCLQLGSIGYYDWLADRADFAVRGCDITHAAAELARLTRLVAVNSALSVDLFGQANLEMLGGRMVSGCGGAPDFARGAALSAGGVSIVALPSTAGRDAASRIVPQLHGLVTLPRTDIDVIVTEHGAADLRGCTVIERGERLISIAAPQHRATLSDAWRDITSKL